MNDKKTAILLLRLGLAFSFLYAGLASLANPGDWVGYLPGFIHTHRLDMLKAFSIFEIVLGLALIAGRWLKYTAFLSALTLLGAVVFNTSIFIVTFRDVGLVFAALALAFLAKTK